LVTDSTSTHSEDSLAAGFRVTWIGSIVNVLLVIFKLWAGIVGSSQALIADGIHSLSDLFSDFVVLLGLKWGRKREDEDHPYGHARIETISSMIVGMMLIIIGIGISYNAAVSIYSHESSNPMILTIWVAALSIVLKEALYWYTKSVGEKLGSLVLLANAWHHRTDALSSVAVLVGVTATYLNPGWYLADSFAALVVTFFVIKIGINLVWRTLRELSDTAPSRDILKRIAAAAGQIKGVRQVHDMRARYSGAQIFVESPIVLDPALTVSQGHDISRRVKHRLQDEFPDVTRLITHIDPELKTQE